MKRWLGLILVCGLSALAGPVSATDYKPAPGTNEVAVVRYDWTDAVRNREVPVKFYFPRTGPGPFPVIIFSHGLGGSREGYQYLGEDWASHGYVSVHLQHLGSDEAVWKNAGLFHIKSAMRESFSDPQNARDRARDVSFAIDQLEKLNRDSSPLQHRLDLSRIGMAGHSFGAETALMVAGERAPELNEDLTDPRIKAAIAMSPPIPKLKSSWNQAFAPIRIPIFVMTGTLDTLDTPANERRIAYDKTSAPGTCLVIFNGLDHMTFSGHVRLTERAKDRKFHPLICDATTAFWDAHLRGNAQAKAWLEKGGFAALMGEAGTFELK